MIADNSGIPCASRVGTCPLTTAGIELQEDNVVESHKRLAKICKRVCDTQDKYVKCCAIIMNNIFQGESLSYMRDRKLSSHMFFNCPIEDSNAKYMDDDGRAKSIEDACKLIGSGYFGESCWN